jgi:membrane protein YqaA with SNARE-associated domain
MIAFPESAARVLRHRLYPLGGLGLILLGLVDSSLIPVPGSLDALTVILSAREPRRWLYYAVMATLGSVIGGYLTYRLARKEGREALQKKLSASRIDKAYRLFGRWGFGAIAIPALLPPPMPMVPFLVVAGLMGYSQRRFLSALTLGRIVRYSLLAFFGGRYGHRLLAAMLRHARPMLIAVIVLAIVVGAVVAYLRSKSKPKQVARE